MHIFSRTQRDDERAWSREPRLILPYLLIGPLFGATGVVVYAAVEGGWISLAIGLLAGLAALLAGGLLGFVFAIPKQAVATAQDGSSSTGPRFISNDNLVEVSDWLTKILVGLGLVQFGRAVDAAEVIVDALARALGDAASSQAFAATLLVVYSISGFLAVYILTRTYLGPVFARSDDAMRRLVDEIVTERVSQQLAGIQPRTG